MKKIVIALLLIVFGSNLKADEGMWIPLFLKYNEAEMQRLGFKLTAEDVYSVNHHSMKDAIMLFAGGCTGELISPEGLLVTNHHCGYSYVANFSTVDNNILQDGFWAKNREEEISFKGLTVTFLISMEDVTAKVLTGTEGITDESERNTIINKNIDGIKKAAVKGTHYTASIKSFYYGNQYFMFINETFKDVRLVGVPPESIGKFGGDTDNWMWPRHTGDFSIYRIYTDKDGKPAEYAKDNIPLKSKKFFNISTKGVEENDFTLVFGYPGSTEQFLTSDAVKQITEIRNPVAIHQRGVRLDIMKKYMNHSMDIRLKYAGKANSISNGWKKWIGENAGLAETKAIEKKIREEEAFTDWVFDDDATAAKYGNILPRLCEYYQQYQPYLTEAVYFTESVHAVELVKFFYQHIYKMINLAEKKDLTDADWNKAKTELEDKSCSFFHSFYKPIDKEIFIELYHYYFSTIAPTLIPQEMQRYINMPKSALANIADMIYEKSIFSDHQTYMLWLEKAGKKDFLKLKKLPLYQLSIPAYQHFFSIQSAMDKLENQSKELYRTYVKALMEKDADTKNFYPDANLTMRVTYGQVRGFAPYDGKEYVYYTTLKGVIAKENPDIFDYKVDPKLKTLFNSQDYGRYGNAKDELPVAFIASNHTTGGNSGSPVINANGELIGINFDRVWEGTMSDINYDVSRCRNISLDVRYFLFIVDKFANAQNIINELTIIN
ncbi:MAG: S46 family peptidase [Bacteroidales bacterium]|jgi:hypothetical protein|nr:S46 family peptidase [Bacteroidales bacterium]